ncbi:L-histidine N(alpha)-methyltransferase [Candidatus Pacearchaeota archaeon]|nr:L-histidine N(alpha)-methyltransferase [Candidatus Pacearchaeota archaeon]
MPVNTVIFNELVKRGYSVQGKKRSWDVANAKLWYLTPELVKGYLNLTTYPPYRKNFIDLELGLLKKRAKLIAGFCGATTFNLIDLGCGDGSKAAAFIKQLPANVRMRYCPVDVSKTLLDMAVKRVRSMHSNKVFAIKPFLTGFSEMGEIAPMLRNSEYQSNVVLLLGGTIAQYDINDFLYQISKDMLPGDSLIIGNGYRTGKRFVHLEKYKDPLFHKWFVHIVKGLGFSEKEVQVGTRFAHGRLEGYYTVLVDKKMTHKGKTVYFRKGDEIIVAIQYKFYSSELQNFCKLYFKDVQFLPEKKGEYCLLLGKK